jgi:hypothetical protein
MPQISHLVRIRGTQQAVFNRVATTDGIAQWFTSAFSTDYKKGGTLELRFPDELVMFEVTDFTEPLLISWRCISENNPWFNTEIVFQFDKNGERTIVRFDHRGWPEVSDLFRDCSMSWAYFLESLRTLIEEGRGTPEGIAPACESAR